MTACKQRECGRTVLWAITSNGKRMPIDPDPNPDGNVVIEYMDFRSTPHVRVLKKNEDTTLPRYMPHAATCVAKKKRAS